MLTSYRGEEARSAVTSPSRVWVSFAAALVIYGVLRLSLLPTDGAVCGGMSNDGAYLSIVAEQVRTGHGFVNPAHWLLVLNPEKLPMPYHNANPGYPSAMSVLAALTGIGVVRAGFVISALSNALLGLAVFALALHYTARWQPAALAAVVTATFPAIWSDSLHLLPDAFCTALSIAAIAIAVRRRDWAGAALAGVVLGAAWEARSSASLILLPLGWWLFRTRPRKEGAQSILLFFVGFLVAIGPWLIHTQRVWGSPFRSDAGIYLLQHYLARPFDGDVDRFWRSLAPPPGLVEVLRREPVQFGTFYLKGLPYFGYSLVATISGWNKLLAVCYVLLTAVAGWTFRHRLRSLEFQAGAMLMLLTLVVLAVRSYGFESRYLGPALVLWVLYIIAALNRWLSNSAWRDWSRPTVALAGVAALSAFMIARQDVSDLRRRTSISPDLAATRDAYRQVAARLDPEARVLTSDPYLYTLYTGRTSLSLPYAPKPRVIGFMSKYSARYMALPTNRLNYYYPDARRQLAPEFRELKPVGPLTLFEVQP